MVHVPKLTTCFHHCAILTDALKSPILSSPDKGGGHELSTVNQAYRVDTGEDTIIKSSGHDSWDESASSSQPSPKTVHKPRQKMGKGLAISQHVNNPESIHQATTKAAAGRFHHDDRRPLASAGLAPAHHLQHLDSSLNFENCCLVQVNQGPFDDRLSSTALLLYIAVAYFKFEHHSKR